MKPNKTEFTTRYREMMEAFGLRLFSRNTACGRYRIELWGFPGSHPDWHEHSVLPPKVVETRYEIRKDLVA